MVFKSDESEVGSSGTDGGCICSCGCPWAVAVVEEFDNEDGGILLVSGSVVDAADFPCDTSQGLVLGCDEDM